ncbi:MAG: hypothetical protein CMJ32_10030 [Phycisphaerae bacterium]|nr:hypothetical protein [Phycisphaerae bacterium]
MSTSIPALPWYPRFMHFLLAILFFATAASAQESVFDDRPIIYDEGVSDVNTLSRSLRILPEGLDLSGGFRRVYQVPGRMDLLMRSNGGLHAIFNESVYMRSKNGIDVPVPPDTIFFIGNPNPLIHSIIPGAPDHLAAGPMSPGVVDPRTRQDQPRPGRIDSGLESPAMVPSTAPGSPIEESSIGTGLVRAGFSFQESTTTAAAEPMPRILTDPVYRDGRVRDLLNRAARSAIAQESGSPIRTGP